MGTFGDNGRRVWLEGNNTPEDWRDGGWGLGVNSLDHIKYRVGTFGDNGYGGSGWHKVTIHPRTGLVYGFTRELHGLFLGEGRGSVP